ncbi:MAG: nucleotidyltransferase family protein [Pyrinomonadaceae bacterium]
MRTALIMASGSSSRFGRPKQLERFEGETLLARSIRLANESADCVFVVLGFECERIAGTIASIDAEIIVNSDWSKGLGSSVKTGLSHLIENHPAATSHLIMLADQPLISSEYFNTLCQTLEKNDVDCVATRYAKHGGVPACFSTAGARFVIERLDDGAGAKPAIAEFSPERRILCECTDPLIDIDTEADLARLRESNAS